MEIPDTLEALRVPIDSLAPYARNPRRGDLELLRASLERHGQYRPIVVNRRSGEVLAGNHTLAAARELGWTEIAATFVDVDADQAARIALIDNRASDRAGYDDRALADLLASLDGDLDATGFEAGDLTGLLSALGDGDGEWATGGGAGSLLARFGVAPFSVLDARSGPWLERKQAWLALGLQSELGREEDLGDLAGPAERQRRYAVPQNKEIRQSLYGTARPFSTHRGRHSAIHLAGDKMDGQVTYAGTSVFDPVLCELAYSWFSAPGGLVLDPFAGGSVRGIVASRLGRGYLGVELRPEQITANEPQADQLAGTPRPRWIEGDARDLLALTDEPADLVFSCPPYFDLETYSDDPRDLSNAGGYDAFCEAHAACIAAAAERLRDDRFAVWVISEIRGPDGNYRGLVPDTIRAFQAAGLALYNEAILVQPASSLPIRAGRMFSTARKLGRTHQNVLVFVKGSGRAAAEACGTVEIDMSAFEEEAETDAA